jgi:hypothetical protein
MMSPTAKKTTRESSSLEKGSLEEDHESDAEDHESGARRSQSHDMFGSSDRLYVGDLDGDLAMLVGGDYYGVCPRSGFKFCLK